MLLPPGTRTDGCVIGNRRYLPCTTLSGVASLANGESGVQRARFAKLIAEIQMIDRPCAVVEHRLLDEPLSQRLDEKIHVALRGSGRDGDVMKSFDAFGQLHHDRSPLFSAIADRLFKPAQRSLLQPVRGIREYLTIGGPRSEEHTSELQSLMRTS